MCEWCVIRLHFGIGRCICLIVKWRAIKRWSQIMVFFIVLKWNACIVVWCVCVVVGTLHVHYITCKSLWKKADVMSPNKKEKRKITTTKTRTCEKTKKKRTSSWKWKLTVNLIIACVLTDLIFQSEHAAKIYVKKPTKFELFLLNTCSFKACVVCNVQRHSEN